MGDIGEIQGRYRGGWAAGERPASNLGSRSLQVRSPRTVAARRRLVRASARARARARARVRVSIRVRVRVRVRLRVRAWRRLAAAAEARSQRPMRGYLRRP